MPEKRITVELPTELYRQLKVEAAARGVAVKALLAEMLAAELEKRRAA